MEKEKAVDSSLAGLAAAGDLDAIRSLFAPMTVALVVDELEREDEKTRAVAFRSLPTEVALAVFEDFSASLQGELIEELREDAMPVVLGLDPDDRASMLTEVPAPVARRLLAGLDQQERDKTNILLGYPPESVGRRMSPEVLTLAVDLTAGEALDAAREGAATAETVYTLPVTTAERRLVGVVSLRRLLVTPAPTPLTEIMRQPILVHASDDQETAARTVRDHSAVAVPVVDDEGRVLGIFTVDDAMRILEHAETEDSARSGGAEPLRRPYLSTPVLGLVRSRIVWLFVLIIAATLTVNVLDYFEDTLAQVVSLALFVPMLIGTGGNAGAQSATTVIRAMALGDARFSDLRRVLGREVATGLLLGVGLGVVGFIPAALVADARVALVLAPSIVVVCTLATMVGALTPMIARQVGVDPAVVSAPFITTFVDATGLIVYFLIARAVLGL